MNPKVGAYAYEWENIVEQVYDGVPIDQVDTWLSLSPLDKEMILDRVERIEHREYFDMI